MRISTIYFLLATTLLTALPINLSGLKGAGLEVLNKVESNGGQLVRSLTYLTSKEEQNAKNVAEFAELELSKTSPENIVQVQTSLNRDNQKASSQAAKEEYKSHPLENNKRFKVDYHDHVARGEDQKYWSSISISSSDAQNNNAFFETKNPLTNRKLREAETNTIAKNHDLPRRAGTLDVEYNQAFVSKHLNPKGDRGIFPGRYNHVLLNPREIELKEPIDIGHDRFRATTAKETLTRLYKKKGNNWVPTVTRNEHVYFEGFLPRSLGKNSALVVDHMHVASKLSSNAKL